jgi:uncharacterized protein YcbK (DUF882 family)
MLRKYALYILCALWASACFNACTEEKECKPIRYIGDYNRDFNDLNDLHLEAATKIGIQPMLNKEEIEKIKRKMTEIKTTKNFELEELTHSVPYIVPKAANLLEKIADNFADSLKSLNAPHYKLIVTSLTRAREEVKRLGNSNINASQNSAHLYGTTFDISWKRFKEDHKSSIKLNEEQLKMVLASVLRDLKKEGACYIKHEKKQACFHITAR